MVLCRNNNELEKRTINKISNIKIKERDVDENYIDFRKDEYVGLRNLAATCYINSVLQQIYHTKFAQLFLEKDIDNDAEGFVDVEELKKIFMRLFSSNKSIVNPSKFIQNTTLFGMEIVPTIQQDSCEFFMSIMNTL